MYVNVSGWLEFCIFLVINEIKKPEKLGFLTTGYSFNDLLVYIFYPRNQILGRSVYLVLCPLEKHYIVSLNHTHNNQVIWEEVKKPALQTRKVRSSKCS